MKKLIFCILSIGIYQFAVGQSNTKIQNFIDTTLTIKEINTYEDTLWVMDSSYSFKSINYELQLSGTYKVLTRDEQGNKLTGLGKRLTNWGEIVNSYLDSITYYDGTNNVNYSYSYSWNYNDGKWMDSRYQLFDENSNMIESYYKRWNMYQNQYINGSRITYEFDNNMLLSITNSIYLPESGEWEPVDKKINYYNEYGKDSIRLNQKWNTYNNQWENELMNITFYNGHERDSVRLKLEWDTGTGQWVNQYKNETFYNDPLNYIDFYGSNWNEVLQGWINDVHAHYESSENGQMETTTHSRWDSIENSWVLNRKAVVLFNETEQILEYLSMLFDVQNNYWINNTKLIYLYNDLNTVRIRYKWDTINGDWIPHYREFYSFVYDNVTDTVQNAIWDSISQQWVFLSRFINVFDHRLNQTNSLSETWDSTDERWKTIQQTNYFWSPFNPLHVVEFELANVKVYPNPGKHNLFVELQPGMEGAWIELVDGTGKQVLCSQIFTIPAVFSPIRLKPGIYFYRVYNQQQVIKTGKWVKM